MSEETDKAVGGCVAGALLPLGWLLDAWVAVRLWAWFVVPFGAPPLTMSWAFGLLILAAFAVKSPHTASKDEDPLKIVMRNLAYALLSLAFGFVAHWIMAR